MTPRRLGLAVAALSLLASQAAAFGTISSLGQNAEHGRITRLSLGCVAAPGRDCWQPASLAALIGRDGDRGAISVPDLSSMAFQSSAHCDNGDYLPTPGYDHGRAEAQAALEACRDAMAAAMALAVDEAGDLVDDDGALDPAAMAMDCRLTASDGAKCRVIRQVGLMLHGSQDFYSHTNWADKADDARPVGPDNPPGLGHADPAPFIALRDPAPFPEGLMSGCFKAIPERAFCNGGPDGRVKHAALNKDEGVIEPVLGAGSTPRGAVQGNFARAVGAAIADTKDKWALLRERLAARYGIRRGGQMACAISHDNPMADCRVMR